MDAEETPAAEDATTGADATAGATPQSDAATQPDRSHPETPSTPSRAAGFLVRHPLVVGWIWVLFWIAIILLLEFTATPDWLTIICVVAGVGPTFVATFVVLRATPRTHLATHDSVLSHFLVRFVTLIFAFAAWTVSIVVGASISSSIQLLVDNDEKEVLGTGFALMVSIAPIVLILLWTALIVRCAWFLVRLRGWSEYPKKNRVPDSLLAGKPRTHRVVIALAHPGLLIVGGFASAIVALLLSIYEPFVVLFE